MWGWAADRHWWCSFVTGKLQKRPDRSSLLLLPTHGRHGDAAGSFYSPFSAAIRVLASWLDRRRWRYLVLVLCSPLLVPLVLAACPFVCAAEIWRIARRKRRRRAEECGGDGGGDEVGLLQRYLEDQLMLVFGSVCVCGDDDRSVEDEGDGDGIDVKYLDSARPLLQ
ncbi:Unknown protein [Striga hermonthica]|uniref:Uncharacterized protein n=1 Tax=Striga hermonthica TaxID=68872 RepID=A0A9N7MLR8_STRHE|nr:Unknown protein [Striga hermonthica]